MTRIIDCLSLETLFVFLECSDLPKQRCFCESYLRLPVVEQRFHPPHHAHGLVKYDAVNAVIGLNLMNPDRLGELNNGVTLQFEISGDTHAVEEISDPAGHDYLLESVPNLKNTTLHAISYSVNSLAETIAFFATLFELSVATASQRECTLHSGRVTIHLREQRGRWRHHGLLTVLHAPRIEQAYQILSAKGLRFRSPINESEIGSTVQFADPTGHRFCLYRPSDEALSWESGATVRRLLAGGVHASRIV